jgi:hypothetical protein
MQSAKAPLVLAFSALVCALAATATAQQSQATRPKSDQQLIKNDMSAAPISPLTKSPGSDSLTQRERAGVRLWQWGGKKSARAR